MSSVLGEREGKRERKGSTTSAGRKREREGIKQKKENRKEKGGTEHCFKGRGEGKSNGQRQWKGKQEEANKTARKNGQAKRGD